ncbi:hypothetical protein FGO68_gene1768 [Halteria grandinella]|uniref:Uncharacterized protein n=1 Tax=Halteria grandinella TaxID=5974 RepID=A0A8J8NZ12_HALGN|nr:hypothetical protein FGO68_gene1768 [Halteria grandinella]
MQLLIIQLQQGSSASKAAVSSTNFLAAFQATIVAMTNDPRNMWSKMFLICSTLIITIKRSFKLIMPTKIHLFQTIAAITSTHIHVMPKWFEGFILQSCKSTTNLLSKFSRQSCIDKGKQKQ